MGRFDPRGFRTQPSCFGEEYLADGITDEIRARLAGLSGLAVIGRQSSIQYKGTDKSAQQIGEELGAAFLLGGTISVRQNPEGSVRVRPQLTKASDATQQWAEVYDDDITDPFQLETEIARKVIAALDITLLDAEQRTFQGRPTDNLEAYQYYDRAILLNPGGLRPFAWKAWLYVDWHGDTEMARDTLGNTSHGVGTRDYVDFVVQSWVSIDVMDGKYKEALDRLSSVSTEAFETQFRFVPKDQLYGQIYGLMNQQDLGRRHYDAARALLESRIAARPGDSRL